MTIAADIDPGARDALALIPSWMHIVFAGPDAEFVEVLRRQFELPITDAHVFAVADAPGSVLLAVDGLVVCVDAKVDGTYDITPVSVGDRPFSNGWNVDAVIAGFESLLMRRVIPTGRAE